MHKFFTELIDKSIYKIFNLQKIKYNVQVHVHMSQYHATILYIVIGNLLLLQNKIVIS